MWTLMLHQLQLLLFVKLHIYPNDIPLIKIRIKKHCIPITKKKRTRIGLVYQFIMILNVVHSFVHFQLVVLGKIEIFGYVVVLLFTSNLF
ncbi:hypothetical protein M0804_014440, partial [Polistes exclamans]